MTNVQLTLAKDAVFQNLVVKGQATFDAGFFQKLTAGLIDGTSVTIDTLTVDTLNSSSTVGNPFAGVTLAPNELVALDGSKQLISYPYSQAATDETVIQRTALNAVNANFLAGSGSSNQLILGTGQTITFNATSNSFNGAIGWGTGSVAASQLTLSGDSSVVNSRSGQNQVAISDDAGAAMIIGTVLDVASGNNSSIVFTRADTDKWAIVGVDLGGSSSQIDIRRDGASGTSMFRFNMFDANGLVEMNGRLQPNANNLYSLGLSSLRWGPLYLTTLSVGSINATADFTSTSPATGLGTTVSKTTATQTSESITYSNNQLIAAANLFFNVSAYGGTNGIPMVQYNNTSGSVILINASTSTALNGTVTFSFGIVNGQGTGL